MQKKRLLTLKRLKACSMRIKDPRRQSGNFRHRLVDILVIALLGIISGCETWEEIADYGKSKKAWLGKELELPNGTPDETTFRRVFARIRPESLENMYREWVTPYVGSCRNKQIGIDGKTIRGVARGSGEENNVHMISAWVREDGITLGQIKVEEKENEIVAIPQLLKTLDIQGSIITIDAMGCQRVIAEKIISSQAHYVLTVKGNQPTLQEEIAAYFQWAQTDEIEKKHLLWDEQTEWTHGRYYMRRTVVSSDIHWFESKKDWPQLRSFIMVERKRIDLQNTSFERQYYISSLEASPSQFASYIRGHWSIENNLHWMLDATFHEDKSLIFAGHAPQNLSVLRKIALAFLKKDTSHKISIRRKQRLAAYDDDFALSLLS